MSDIKVTKWLFGLMALLKHKTAIPKLVFSYYVRVYGRIGGRAILRREAAMPLNFTPKLDKIVELLLYLAHKRPGADKYQAVKFFYLADREHLSRYGRPISYDNYYALPYGPVASKTLDFLNNKKLVFREAGIKSLPFETEIGTVTSKSGKEYETTFIRKPLRKINKDLFSKSDLKVFDEIITEHGDDTFDELYDQTHEHYAYDHAWKTRREGDRAQMYYEEMIEDEEQREALVEDISPIAAHMK